MSYVSKNFQAESKQSGDAFENLVEETLLFDNFQIIKKNYKIDELGIEVDFFCQKDGFNYYIEAKGGEKGPKKRPGAERTDNVKKALCNGALIKAKFPKSKYLIYFSAKPKQNSSSEKMLAAGMKYSFINKVIYLTK